MDNDVRIWPTSRTAPPAEGWHGAPALVARLRFRNSALYALRFRALY
ncbi:hypothetical protein ABZ851_23760 [Streptomyces sp. NPDC047049]